MTDIIETQTRKCMCSQIIHPHCATDEMAGW